jgi:phosphoribosyl 1,2-cyclic phosphodiesterase
MKGRSGNKISVTFWGTRGSIPTPGRDTEKYGGNTSCVSVQHEDTLLILDAGTGIRNLGLDLVAKSKNKSLDLHVLLSHTHWDHIQGLPFFRPAYTKGTKLTVYGSPNKEEFLESILSGQMDEDYFPVEMKDLAADVTIKEIRSRTITVGAMEIEWHEQVLHPGGSVRYRLSIGDKRIVYASDVELDRIFGPNKDSRQSKALAGPYRDFIQGVDLLIADGQYTSEEYKFTAGYGHTTIPVITEVARQQEVRQLAVFHHDPQHSDADIDRIMHEQAAACRAKSQSTVLFGAKEGMTISL